VYYKEGVMMIKINGTTIKTPSSLSWGLQDLSSQDSGRTLDGVMHKDLVAQKRKLECKWNNLTKQEASTLLRAVNSSIYLRITYPDPMSGRDETRTFYVGDRTAPFHMWTSGKQIFDSVSFNFVER